MVSMGGRVNIETKAEGGILKSSGRAMLSGESFFQNFCGTCARYGVELITKVSIQMFMLANGIAILEASGNGNLLVSFYGAIFDRAIESGEKYVVSITDHYFIPDLQGRSSSICNST